MENKYFWSVIAMATLGILISWAAVFIGGPLFVLMYVGWLAAYIYVLRWASTYGP